MAALIPKISNLFKRLLPSGRERTTRVELPKSDYSFDYDNFRETSQRSQVIREVRKMYEGDPRCKESLHTLGRDSVEKGFEISVKDARIKEIIDSLMKRLKILKLLDDTVRLSARDGDTFFEVVVNDKMEIIDLTRKPTLKMHRNTNDSDQFENPSKAFTYKENEYTEDGIHFPLWQIIHLRWQHDKEKRYGTPQYASATTAFNRMREGEIDLATRRKANAGLKMLHFVDGDEVDIERYKEINADALNKPFRAITNFFTNREGSIKQLQGDQNIGNIKDVQHHIDTWSTASPVPLFLLGYGSDLNRDILTDQREQYRKTLYSVTEWLNDEILIPIIDLQLLLLGYWPNDINYVIEWLRYANTREDKFNEANAMMDTVQTTSDAIEGLRSLTKEDGSPLLADEFIIAVVEQSLTTIFGSELMANFAISSLEPSESDDPEEDSMDLDSIPQERIYQNGKNSIGIKRI